MSSGLVALLDDVVTIAKMAAASLDDVAATAGKAGTKAAGVVIDDTAVTPQFLEGFSPDRELPIIWRIAKGSVRNKLVFILPAALLLSGLMPWAITPILMIGGAYLCFEGVEKLLEKAVEEISGDEDTLAEEVAELVAVDHEAEMVRGAIRTDFILSAEIMAIALAELKGLSIMLQAATLVVVALAITAGVYGVVALIVKMDDIGLHLAQTARSTTRMLGRTLVRAMPVLLTGLSGVGTAAMIWVGGGIILHGLEEFGVTGFPHFIHDLAHQAGEAAFFANDLVSWLINAVGSGIVGGAVGAAIVAIHHRFAKKH